MSGLQPHSAELAAAVSERELLRLVGMPRGRELEGDLRARADGARAWYAEHGGPFAASRRIDVKRVSASVVRLADGSALRSEALADGLRATRGHAVVVLAVSAGREVAAEASRLWASDRPDQAYFLDRFAAAVAEALVLWAAAAECRAASEAGETLLPPLSPGCGSFEIGDQQCLARALGALPSGRADPQEGEREAGAGRLRLGPLELLATGSLDPPHSLLAALGVTREALPPATPEDLCRACALARCTFRRA